MQTAPAPLPTAVPRKSGINWRLPAFALFESGDASWSMIVVSLYFGDFVQNILNHPGAHFTGAVTLGALVIALLSPGLGAAADLSGPRKPYMAFFIALVVALTALIGQLHSFAWAVGAFVLAYIAANGGFNFFMGMIPANAAADKVHTTVSTAVALGYTGSLICMVGFGVVMPKGRPDLVFLPMAGMYLLFTLPCLLWARDFPKRPGGRTLDLGRAYRNVWQTLREAKQHKPLFRFLIGDFLYENAVASVIVLMGLYTRNVMGFTSGETTLLFGPAIIVAILAAFGFSWLVKRIGPKKAVLVDLAVWLLLFASVILIHDKTLFKWVCAPLAGIGLAGVWSSSRVLLTALTPVGKSGQFWGLYNLSGRSASVVGDATTTLVLVLLGESAFGYRMAMVALAAYVVLGAIMILTVPDARPTADNVLAPEVA